MQDDVHALGRFGDGAVIERIGLDRPSAGGCAAGGTGPDQAGNPPSGIAERLPREIADASGGAQDQDSTAHVALPCRLPAGGTSATGAPNPKFAHSMLPVPGRIGTLSGTIVLRRR